MPRIDDEYIKALQSFTGALEAIVETLKKQQKGGKADTVNEMLKNVPNQLQIVVDDLNKIKTDTITIKSNTDVILAEIKSIKQSKESGMFDKVEDPKNKNKIVDGIKVVILIAAGVLAMGMAFKIIGKIDVFSVIGLSVGILIMATAFAQISNKTKGLTIGRALLLSGVLVVISFALVMASQILINTAILTPKTILAVSFTAIAMGAALFLLTKSVENIKFNFKTVVGLLLLPFLAPIIATVIVKSSNILKNTSYIDLKTIVSITLTSIAIGIALYAITTALSKMSMKSDVISMLTKGALFGLLIAAVAGGIVIASGFFSKITPITLMQGLTAIFVAITLGIVLFTVSKVIQFAEGISLTKAIAVGALMVVVAWSIKKSSEILSGVIPFSFSFAVKLIITSIAIGVALYVFSYAWKRFATNMISITNSGVGIGKPSDSKTVQTILAVAIAIVLVSQILRMGNYDGPYPDWQWTLSVGLSLVTFGGFMLGLATLQSKAGFIPKFDGRDIMNVVLTATAIVLVSLILQFGKYDNAPPIDWVAGVGLSLVVFGAGMFVVGKYDPTGTFMAMGALAVLIISATIMLSSWVLSVGSYGNYPSVEWSAGVGLSLFTFGISMTALGVAIAATFGLGYLALLAGAAATLMVANTIVDVANILSGGKFTGGPSLNWATGTGLLMVAFTTSVVALGLIAMTGLGYFAILAGTSLMKDVATSIVEVSKILAGGKYVGGPTFEWANGVGTAITAFAGAIATMGSATGGIMSFFTGIDTNQMKTSISTVVDGMVEANKKLSDPKLNWSKNYPSKEWSEGVGIAVSKFAEATRTLYGGPLSKDLTSTFVSIVEVLMDGVIKAGVKMQEANNVKWSTLSYPKSEWVLNIGKAIQTLLDLSRSLEGGRFSKDMINKFQPYIDVMVTGLISIGRAFSTNVINWDSLSSPNKKFMQNFSDSVSIIRGTINNYDIDIEDMNNFVEGMKILIPTLILVAQATQSPINELFIQNFEKLVIQLNNFPDKSRQIRNLAASFRDLSDSLKDLKSFDNLTKVSAGLVLLSAVDDARLQIVLDKIKENADTLKTVFGSNDNLLSSITSTATDAVSGIMDAVGGVINKAGNLLGGVTPNSTPSSTTSISSSTSQETMASDISEIKIMFSQLVDNMNRPTNTTIF